jgi:hypothetical protein
MKISKISNMSIGVIRTPVGLMIRIIVRSCTFASLSEITIFVDVNTMVTQIGQSTYNELIINWMQRALLMQSNDSTDI